MVTDSGLYPVVDFQDYPSWLQRLVDCKKQFLHHDEDPRNMTCLRSYIAESWLRSKRYGIDPYSKTLGKKLTTAELELIKAKNSELIQLVCSLIGPFRAMLQRYGYGFAVTDNNGVFLYVDGSEKTSDFFAGLNAGIGSVWREELTGTTAHALSLLYKSPILLLGPEHYCLAFQNTISASAPILDEKEELMGTLIVAKLLPNTSWENCYEVINYHIHTLYLVIAMARAIESQNRMKKRETYLQNINANLVEQDKIIESVIATIEEGCLITDSTGRITHINDRAARMFKLMKNQCQDRHIWEFLPANSSLLKAFQNRRRTTYIDEVFKLGNEQKRYKSCLVPMFTHEQFKGAIIRTHHTGQEKSPHSVAKFTFDDLLGNSQVFKSAKKLAHCFAKSKEPILLTGESGTGKELFAQAIHNTYCPYGPFIVVNCAGIPKELMESEFFGYEGGSFTGASREGKPGKIELAHGGTLFLDEIGDMPLELQAVLLRALEYKQIMRVGGKTYVDVDFRLISATNKDLVQLVKNKSFREDLFFRLSVLTINIPPLRERGNDINLLVDYFIKKTCRELGKKPKKLSGAARKRVNEYPWPGNVRQLKNAIIHAITVAQEDTIEPEHLPGYLLEDPVPAGETAGQLQQQTRQVNQTLPSFDCLEKEIIEKVLFMTKYNVAKAANLLGVSKSTMYRKLKKHNIEY